MYLQLHVALMRRKTIEVWESSNKAMLFIFFISGYSPGSEFHAPTFIKFKRREITQSKEYNLQNKAKVLNQGSNSLPDIGELWVEKYCYVYRI
jgi:hypothetical protein